ncbi:G2E3-like protein, partial [Mya arenaria]
MAAPRHICIAAHPQGETVSFPSTSTGLSLGLATLRSHFPRATGLKYMDADNWVAVAVENDTFNFPNDEEQHLYIVVSGESGAIDTAHQVLSNRSLPSELTALFNRTTSRPSDIMMEDQTRCLDDSSDDELPDINTADTITAAAKLAGTMKTFDSTSATMTTTSLFAGTTASAGVPSSITSTTNNHPASPVTTADGLDTGTPDLEVTFYPRHYRSGRLSLRQQRDKCTPCSSNSSKSVIEICDSEDEEMSRAIEASLNDRKKKTTTSIEHVPKEYRDGALKKDVSTDVIVFRSFVLESTFRAITRKSFNPNRQLYVKFSGEMGDDYGGPRREFFRLSLKELMNSSIFNGQEGQKYLSHDVTSLDEGKYRLAGRLVALSLAQDGPGLHSLSTTLYDLMTDLDPDMSSASVPEDIQHMITQIKEVDNDTKRDKFLTEYMDWFIDRGFNDIYKMILNEKDRLIQMMMKHFIFYRTLAEITEFTRGLNDVGHLWEVVTRHRKLFKPIFCHKPTGLTKDVVDGLCKIEFSEPGKIEIMFYDQEDGVTRLPSVSTCGLQMWLPRGVGEPDTISSFIQTAVKGSQGFHK